MSDPPETRRAEAGPGLKVAMALVAVLVVVLAATVGALYFTQDGRADRRDKIVASARQEAYNLFNVDYRSAQKSADLVLKGATGEFRDQWAGGFSKQVVDTATKEQSVQTMTAVHIGVVNDSATSAEVILSVSSTVTTPQVTSGTQRNTRWSMQLTKGPGGWLVSKFGIVP